MSIDASIPKALYQANIDLALRIAALLQESGAQWFDLFADEANARLQQATAQAEQPGIDPRSPLPPDMALKWMQLNPGRWQALLMQAANKQSHFAEGLQAALHQWQAASSEAFGKAAVGGLPGVPDALKSLPGWQEMTDMMQGFVANFVPPFEMAVTTKAAPRESAKPVATPAPAAVKPAATKPAATKPAATKPAAAKPAATKPAATKPAPSRKSPANKATAKSSKAGAGNANVDKPKAGKTNTTKAATRAKAAKTAKPAPAAVTRSRRSKKTGS